MTIPPINPNPPMHMPPRAVSLTLLEVGKHFRVLKPYLMPKDSDLPLSIDHAGIFHCEPAGHFSPPIREGSHSREPETPYTAVRSGEVKIYYFDNEDFRFYIQPVEIS